MYMYYISIDVIVFLPHPTSPYSDKSTNGLALIVYSAAH